MNYKPENENKRMNPKWLKAYDKCGWGITNFDIEPESREYEACKFQLNGLQIISRTAKITPKKIGQFVTLWKRNEDGIIEPYTENDQFDFVCVNVAFENNSGQFVFPKSVLLKKGVISSLQKEGKRALRVYPQWDKPESKQGKKSQQWQLDYFYKFRKDIDIEKMRALFQ